MSEKWWDMSDDELDDLFREASDKVDVPFDSTAYNKLRQKIAAQPMSEPSRGFKKSWLLLLAGLFLMVGVGLVYRFGDDLKEDFLTENVKNVDTGNKVKPRNVPLPVETQTTSLKKLERSSVGTQTTTLVKPLNVPLSVGTQTTTLKKLEKSSVSPQTTAERSSVGTQTTAESSAGTQTTAKRIQTTVEDSLFSINKDGKTLLSVSSQTTTTENLAKSSVKTQTTTAVVENKQVTFGLNNQKTYAIEQNKVIENIDFESVNKKNKLIRFNNSKNNKDREGKNYPLNSQISEQSPSSIIENSSNNLKENLPEETISKTNFYDVNFLKNKDSKSLSTDIRLELPPFVDSLPRTMKPVKFSRFGLRLVLSPDFNSIENMEKMALGGSVGLLFEYKISKKLVIQTGMVYSSKSYVGSFDDYNNWKDWKGYHPSKPTEVDGGCSVFDIPINIRLNLFQKPKQTWFISSGVSSYWMMKENYTYNYAWGLPREVGWNDNSKYYFSMMNFSVGFEKQISKRLNFQIEPYLKTPLKNLGRGGVNLYSSGVLFSTKYEF
jgi:hypothetical protein